MLAWLSFRDSSQEPEVLALQYDRPFENNKLAKSTTLSVAAWIAPGECWISGLSDHLSFV